MRRSATSSRPEVPTLTLSEQPATEAPVVIKYIELNKTNWRVRRRPEASSGLFSYQRITSRQAENIPNDGVYRSVPRASGAVSFALNQLDTTRLLPNESYPEHGLKIHISLDDEIPGNAEKGWNAIAPILRYYNIARVKVTDITRMQKDVFQEPNERGKQITIYACLHPPGSNWKNALTSITRALLARGVEPGYRPDLTTCKEVPNNCYLSYRYDMDPRLQRYRKAAHGSGAFPVGVEDSLIGSVQNIQTRGREPKQSAEFYNTPEVSRRLMR